MTNNAELINYTVCVWCGRAACGQRVATDGAFYPSCLAAGCGATLTEYRAKFAS